MIRTLNVLSYLKSGLATGGGISKRKLFTDSDEAVFKILRPVIINGIEEPSHRPDFLDRCVMLALRPISEGQRVAETELNKAFEADFPKLLGGAYALLSECLRVLPTINEKNLPRMTDYALMGIAIERVLKLKPGYFLRAYNKNRNEQSENAFWNDELCNAIYGELNSQKKQQHESIITESGTPIKRTVWVPISTPLEGTAQELSQKLFKQGKFSNQKPPKGRAFSGWLKRIEPLLNQMDIVVERPQRTSGKRTIIIRWADRPDWMDL